MVLGLFFCGSLQAQQQTISGNVIDVNGEPIIGATVQAKGTSTGTVTDVNGHYTVSVPASATTLVVSYVGFETREMAITGNVVNVALSENATALNEVVVIGYGTVRRRDLTGSVSSVGADAIAAIPVASAAEAITGKMAGVQITTLEGSPDTEIKIRVRGGGSITGDNMPLYIVDGFPVESISDVPPGDIESIDVLKDASSTAIYGSRGANGVIIITTKSGKEGKINVSYNAYIGWKKIAKKLDVLSPYDYALWQYERAMLADGKPDKYVSFFGNFQDIDLYKDVTANDWQEQVFGRTGFTNNHNLSINGGAEKSKYAFSYNHLDDKAIMQLSSYKRDNLSLKLNNKPTDKFTLDFSVRFSNTEIRGGGANEVNE
ncbi:MAG: SusC/RagA family TonB-linked outer membrane protein, partial [Tannerella sp.]|nr:SusC/RagA family TonB-linked outer membrane protein [Tannerella sp.]